MPTKMSWDKEEIAALFDVPLFTLINQAQAVHQQHFNPNEIELCTLLNIKTGACPENCAYCPQSGHYDTGVKKEKLLALNEIVERAKQAKQQGATRFCMGAAWRNPPKSAFPQLIKIIKAINALGLETCLTAGTLDENQVSELDQAKLNYYNHNLDTSEKYYTQIITTHTYQDRLETLARLSHSHIKTCCGGIVGLGETKQDRIEFLWQLTQLQKVPESIPLNKLIPIKGTPLENQPAIDNFDFIRTVAAARILFPCAMIRLSAGRLTMSEEMQALCFLAGANSLHFGEKLLITQNPAQDKDLLMLKKLGLTPKTTSRATC